MKPISINEINGLGRAKQYFQDCYLVSSIGALANSHNGQKILQKNIAHTDNGYRIKFQNVKGQAEDYFVTQKEIEELVYMDKYMNPIPLDERYPHNPIIKAIEVAMNKLLKKHPSKKSITCRLANCNEKFEFNKPSNFLNMFTGEKPIILNEGNIYRTLKSKKEETTKLLNEMSKTKDNSFVAGTSILLDRRLNDFHCYSIKSVNKDTQELELFDHRHQNIIKLTYEEAIKKLKFLVGYFENGLK